MERTVGTVVRGLRAPIIRQGDDIAAVAVQTLLHAANQEGFAICDQDVLGMTESIVARAQGNYATVAAIHEDLEAKLGGHVPALGLVFPILSRNRFAMLLKGIAAAADKLIIQFSYPADEVGNHLVSLDQLDAAEIDPWKDELSESTWVEHFGRPRHSFTGMDYVAYYRSIVEEAGAVFEAVFANDCRSILNHSDLVLTCDIHSRERSKRLLQAAGAKMVLGLDDLLNASVQGSGFNADFGLLGSNKADEERVKLFPRDCQAVVDRVAAGVFEKTGKRIEVLVYGDGAFKDPVGKIWELADPVVSPAYTSGLQGTPNELKLKYLADNDFSDLSEEEQREAITASIKSKNTNLVGSMAAEGTTPRQLTDLIGSLCDLTSGSGDKGTPIVFIQGYFDNFAD